MLSLQLRLLTASVFYLVHDDPVVDDPEIDPEIDPNADPNPDPKKVKDDKKQKLKVPLTDEQQQFVNSLLAEEKRKSRLQNEKTITQLETLRNSVSTTQAEKESLEARIEDIKNSQLTAEEMRKKEVNKEKKKLEDRAIKAEDEAKLWKERYTTSTIQRSIIDAAITNKAHNPKHIVSIVAPDTRLVEELDDEGKPTGELIPKVRVKSSKDGKPATLEMTVTEAVKFFSEQEEHEALFNSGAASGLGGNTNSRRKSGDSDEIPEDPVLYQQWREKNREKVGLQPRRGSSK